MTWLDRFLQRWRMRMALRQLPDRPRLLDLGTHNGMLFELAAATGVGIDPELVEGASAPAGVTLIRGFFPQDLAPKPTVAFDAATALAVLEHVPEGQLETWAEALYDLLKPGGRLVVTVPAPAVDGILHLLMRLHLVAGMEAHQHHGFQPRDLERIFSRPRWETSRHRTFQLGLNHLYVFTRSA